jgi:hypothetical protein
VRKERVYNVQEILNSLASPSSTTAELRAIVDDQNDEEVQELSSDFVREY